MSAATQTTGSGQRAGRARDAGLAERVFRIRESGILVVLVLFVAVTTAVRPRFLDAANIQFLLVDTATFALLASSNWSKAEDGCVDLPYDCSSDAVNQADSASTQATIANVAFIAGGAALGASLVLFLTSSDDPASTELAITPASVSLRGRF